jgi:hypothetical protein
MMKVLVGYPSPQRIRDRGTDDGHITACSEGPYQRATVELQKIADSVYVDPH